MIRKFWAWTGSPVLRVAPIEVAGGLLTAATLARLEADVPAVVVAMSAVMSLLVMRAAAVAVVWVGRRL